MNASVVITCFNYERWVGGAIESALAQTHRPLEVIVVDDGSTDGSREVIESYGDAIRTVFKENGGQTSALNAGWSAASGEIVCFLDADDTLDARAIEHAVEAFADPAVVKVHWPLREVDADSQPTGDLRPPSRLADGDLRPCLLAEGPESFTWVATSGNAYRRALLDRLMPAPERGGELGRATHTDAYLATLAPLFGQMARLDEPHGCFRVHGGNHTAGRAFDDVLALRTDCFDFRCGVLAEWCERLGLPADPEGWRERSWLHRFPRLRAEIEALVPPGAAFVLADDGQVGDQVAPGRRAIPFTERGGEYWGPPADDADALGSLARARAAGAEWLIVAWPAFWLFDCYPGFADHARRELQPLHRSDLLHAYALHA
jgi:glycosyltransferase involved in cell wall biosynthesis